jgi:hypothetical protein
VILLYVHTELLLCNFFTYFILSSLCTLRLLRRARAAGMRHVARVAEDKSAEFSDVAELKYLD